MKILIIGSKGFIGSRCRELLGRSYSTFGCDVVADYADTDYYLIDPTNANYRELFRENQFDACINCSGAASVPDSLRHPMRDFELNTANVFRMLDAIRQYNPECRFINISSAAVYGNPDSLPINESMHLEPISPYGRHKMYSEQICDEFYRTYGLQTASARVFSAYGPGLRKQLFWDLDKMMTSSPSVILFGTGAESRDFVYIDDIIIALGLILEKGTFTSEKYNIASGTESEIRDAAELFKEVSGHSAAISFSNEFRKGDPQRWRADISLISSLGFQPSFPLKDGLKKYVEWLRS